MGQYKTELIDRGTSHMWTERNGLGRETTTWPRLQLRHLRTDRYRGQWKQARYHGLGPPLGHDSIRRSGTGAASIRISLSE